MRHWPFFRYTGTDAGPPGMHAPNPSTHPPTHPLCRERGLQTCFLLPSTNPPTHRKQVEQDIVVVFSVCGCFYRLLKHLVHLYPTHPPTQPNQPNPPTLLKQVEQDIVAVFSVCGCFYRLFKRLVHFACDLFTFLFASIFLKVLLIGGVVVGLYYLFLVSRLSVEEEEEEEEEEQQQSLYLSSRAC